MRVSDKDRKQAKQPNLDRGAGGGCTFDAASRARSLIRGEVCSSNNGIALSAAMSCQQYIVESHQDGLLTPGETL